MSLFSIPTLEETSETRLVIVESPFGGSPHNPFDGAPSEYLCYLRSCLHDCVMRAESPYASHALLTQPGVLDDNVEGERELGVKLGFGWRHMAHATVLYTDFGISRGMLAGLGHAQELVEQYQQTVDYKRHAIEYRQIGWKDAKAPLGRCMQCGTALLPGQVVIRTADPAQVLGTPMWVYDGDTDQKRCQTCFTIHMSQQQLRNQETEE